jgi:hypothetical protein
MFIIIGIATSRVASPITVSNPPSNSVYAESAALNTGTDVPSGEVLRELIEMGHLAPARAHEKPPTKSRVISAATPLSAGSLA